LLDCVTRSELRLLTREPKIRARHGLAHLLTAVTIYDNDTLRVERSCGPDYVAQEWLPCNGMQHFRQARMHALADARSENDNV